MAALERRCGMLFEEQYTTGRGLIEMPDKSVVKGGLEEMPFPPEELKAINDFFVKVTSTGLTIDKECCQGPFSHSLDKITFQDWINNETDCSKAVTWSMQVINQALVGARSDEFSTSYILCYYQSSGGVIPLIGAGKGTGQHLRAHTDELTNLQAVTKKPHSKHSTGSKTFTNGLASELPQNTIHLNGPVSKIHQSHTNQVCHTTTPCKTYTSKNVIVSIPSPLYSHITFSSLLPMPKHRISINAKLGYYTKVTLICAHPWWRLHNLTGSILSAEETVIFTADTYVPSQQQFSLSMFVLGPQGREWAKQPQHDRWTAVKQHVRFLFGSIIGSENVPDSINILEKDWAADEWFCGAPSTIYGRGVLQNGGFKVMAEPCGHVHFVRTETSEEFEGYMEGAVRSGVKGAKEVIEALKG